MTVRELYSAHYNDYRDFCDEEATKYEWAASEVFDLTTYDGELDEKFVVKIVDVLKAILDRKTFEYIEGYGDSYTTYIIVCQLLIRFNWINWGTSIRGAWLDTYHAGCKIRPILDSNLEKYGCKEISCTEQNLRALIAFIEEVTNNDVTADS